jgi:hypothetical protein
MWCFRRKALGEKIRNPIQGEFFATEAIDGPAQALVRESIQNSLDARNGDGPVRVRITLASGENALAAGTVKNLFAAAWPHYHATGNGLHAAPHPSSSCPYLVIEDFGTKGLTGDPGQSDPDPDPEKRNPFFLFFRAEGLSAKTGTDLGRWGVGKFVFPRSSLVSTHFGVTVRHDDRRRLLLGAVTLKAHRVEGDDAVFSPDGLYGRSSGDDFVLPIEDPRGIDSFCALFGITRTTEPGLSVVVPFVDPEITFEGLLLAATKDYFLPILDGRLEITIACGQRLARLTDETLDEVVSGNQVLLGDGIHATLTLARYAISAKAEDRIAIGMPNPTRAARWSDHLVPPDILPVLQTQIAGDSPVAVRVPLTVRSKSDGDLPSWFDIFLVRDKDSEGRPMFVREGIIVSDVRGRRAREVRSLVMIDDRPLATMLGDSENPAHTQWQKDGSNFKGRYTYGPSVISFVADCVGELLAILNRRSEKADPKLTVDFFSIEPPEEPPEDSEPAEKIKRKPKTGPEIPEDEVRVEPRPTRVQITRDQGGFSVIPGSAPPQTPYLVEVRCAYDIRAGNPLRKWDAADFQLASSEVPITCEGEATLLQAKGNWALLRVDGPAFHARFSGFDLNRDVYVRVDLRQGSGADPET